MATLHFRCASPTAARRLLRNARVLLRAACSAADPALERELRHACADLSVRAEEHGVPAQRDAADAPPCLEFENARAPRLSVVARTDAARRALRLVQNADGAAAALRALGCRPDVADAAGEALLGRRDVCADVLPARSGPLPPRPQACERAVRFRDADVAARVLNIVVKTRCHAAEPRPDLIVAESLLRAAFVRASFLAAGAADPPIVALVGDAHRDVADFFHLADNIEALRLRADREGADSPALDRLVAARQAYDARFADCAWAPAGAAFSERPGQDRLVVDAMLADQHIAAP